MILIADNLQITRPDLAAALDRMDPDPICELVGQCEAAGAQAIDINSGPLTRDPVRKMAFLVDAAAAATRLPLFLDTANPKALEAGLRAGQNYSNQLIINGFSLEPRKIDHILPLARTYEADIVGYLLFPDSQVPVDEGDLINVAIRLYQAFQGAGLSDDQLIIDPVVAPVIWENGVAHNLSVLSLLRQLPDLLGFPVRTMAGLSNLTTGKIPKDKKQLLEQSFLPVLAGAGLSMVLLNVLHSNTVQTARTCDALLSPGVFSWMAI